MKFRSGFEKKVYEHATRGRRIVEYEPKHSILHYTKPATYLPDFVLPSGIRIECKGYFGPRDRAKLLAVKKCNPGCDIRLVFQRANNRLTKSKNSMMYWEWCEKHGFPWSETTIPDEWHDE